MNADQLPFVLENDPKVLPTFPVVVAQPGMWARELDTGMDWVKIVHGEHDVVMHKPLPAGRHRHQPDPRVDAIDKGPGKGALIISQRKVYDKATGELYTTITQTTFGRGDGGFGGPQRPSPSRTRCPSARPTPFAICRRAPRWRCSIAGTPT